MLSEYTFIVEMQDSKSTVRLHATVKKLRWSAQNEKFLDKTAEVWLFFLQKIQYGI